MSYRKPFIRNAICLLCIIIFLLAGRGQVYAIDTFHIERPKLGVDFSFRYEDDQRDGAVTSTSTHTSFSERLDIETEGWVYHPALLQYTLIFSPEWNQAYRKSGDEGTDSSRSSLEGYLTKFTILPYKPYTLTLYGAKYMSALYSSFAERTERETDVFRAILDIKYQTLPTTLSYNHTENRQTGFFSNSNRENAVRMDTKYDRHLGDTRLSALYSDNITSQRGTSFSTLIKDVTLQNFYSFPENKTASLNTSLVLRDTRSDFSSSRILNWADSLSLRHSKNLTTNYSVRYERNNMGNAGRREFKGIGFGLDHLLYENLTTSLDIEGTRNQSQSGKENIFTTGLSWNYSRKIPWGRLGAHMGHTYRHFDLNLVSEFIPVTDEPVNLRFGEITLLANELIELDSIVVTEKSGFDGFGAIYASGLDYETTKIGDSVRITCINGGNIDGPTDKCGSGAPVFIHYKYRNNPPFDYYVFDSTYGVNASLWDMLDFYYRISRSKQHFLRGVEPETLTASYGQFAGATLTWKWSKTVIDFSDSRSSSISIKTWRASETISASLTDRLFISISGSTGQSTVKETGGTDKANGARINLQRIISDNSFLTVESFWNTLSGPAVRTEEKGLSSVYQWFYGIYHGDISYTYSDEKDKISDESRLNHVFLVNVKRESF
ncbi:MAG: hypothetical protein HY808_15630 [Nitrospirae bacterium]|nr:hypothetical protein [Nitrospirota bacterium]